MCGGGWADLCQVYGDAPTLCVHWPREATVPEPTVPAGGASAAARGGRGEPSSGSYLSELELDNGSTPPSPFNSIAQGLIACVRVLCQGNDGCADYQPFS